MWSLEEGGLYIEIEQDNTFVVNEEVKKVFNNHGYIIVRNLLNGEELQKLRTALESDKGVLEQYHTRDDGRGRQAKVSMWKHPGNDITGVISRSEKVAGTMEKLLDDEVYHYHSKVILKEAKTGGAHVWHQDYGYWYENWCLYPNMGTVWVAVDKADKRNGCVQLLHASHKIGRINHVKVGEQVGADTERVEQVKKFCPLIHCEVEPGDAIFFHCNVIHCSAQNNSDRRRWAYLVCYNTAKNNPVKEHHLPQYTPLKKIPNSAILECSTETDMTGKEFFGGPKEDESLKSVASK